MRVTIYFYSPRSKPFNSLISWLPFMVPYILYFPILKNHPLYGFFSFCWTVLWLLKLLIPMHYSFLEHLTMNKTGMVSTLLGACNLWNLKTNKNHLNMYYVSLWLRLGDNMKQVGEEWGSWKGMLSYIGAYFIYVYILSYVYYTGKSHG